MQFNVTNLRIDLLLSLAYFSLLWPIRFWKLGMFGYNNNMVIIPDFNSLSLRLHLMGNCRVSLVEGMG